MTNSTTYNGSAVADDVSGTAFPLDTPGFVIPFIPRGDSATLVYRATILAAGSIANSARTGDSAVSVTNVVYVPPPVGADACSLDFTDAGGTPVAAYARGADVHVLLTDNDANLDTGAVDTVSVVVEDLNTGDYETIVLTELGADSGMFLNTAPLPSSISLGLSVEDGILYVAAGDTLSVTYTDPIYHDFCNATAPIAVPSETKYLYLSTDGQGSPTRTWTESIPWPRAM